MNASEFDNMHILQTEDPSLWALVQEAPIRETYQIGAADQGGFFIATTKEDGSLTAWQSIVDPNHAAERFAKQFAGAKYICVFGFGAGYEARKLAESPTCKKIVIYEPSLSMFRFVMEHYDLSELLRNPKIKLYVGKPLLADCRSELYDHITIMNYPDYQYAPLPYYDRYYAEEEEEFREMVQYGIDCMEANYNTMCKFSKKAPENALYAFRYLAHAKNIYDLRGKFDPDISCILICAGPSLEKNVEELKKAKGKAFLLCMDTAVSYCLDHGVIPDCICSIDPLKADYYKPDARAKEIPLVTATVADHRYIEAFHSGTCLYMGVHLALHMDLLQKLGVDIPYEPGWGSVSIAAFELAYKLGFKKIVFVGQDLAITPDKFYAFSNETTDARMRTHVDKTGLYEVEGYDGTTVYTTADYHAYLTWFALRIAEYTDVWVADATEGGARIPGTVCETLATVVEQHCGKAMDFRTILEGLPCIVKSEQDWECYHAYVEERKRELSEELQQWGAVGKDETRLQEVVDRILAGPYGDIMHQYAVEAEAQYQRTGNSTAFLARMEEGLLFFSELWKGVEQTVSITDISNENERILQERYPEVYMHIMEAQPEEPVYTDSAGLKGEFLALERGGRYYAIGSTYDPVHEAERFLGQFHHLPETMELVLFGFGMGYVVQHLLRTETSVKRVIVFEPSYDVFRAAIGKRNLSRVLSDPRLSLFVGEAGIASFRDFLMEQVGYYNMQNTSYQALPQYMNLFPEFESVIREIYDAWRKQAQMDYMTQVRFKKIETICEIHAPEFLYQAKNLHKLASKDWSEIPCILVAAGPSLRKNVKEISHAKGKAAIICVDVAANYLASEGIIPDMICTIDSGNRVRYTQWNLKGVPLAVTTSSCAEQLERGTQGDYLYYSCQSQVHENLFAKLGEDMPCVSGGGSVALDIFEFAVRLGFKTIILAGQDLASAKGEFYASGKKMSDKEAAKFNIEVEGYYGDSVLTNEAFRYYRDWYVKRLKQEPDVTMINATEGGLRIEGTIQMPLKDAIAQYCKEQVDMQAEIARIPYMVDSEEKRTMVCNAVEDQYRVLSDLLERSDGMRSKLQEGIRLAQGGKLTDTVMQKLTADNEETLDYMSTGDYSDMLYRCMVQVERNLASLIDASITDPIAQSVNLYQSLLYYYDNLSETLRWIVLECEEVKTNVEALERNPAHPISVILGKMREERMPYFEKNLLELQKKDATLYSEISGFTGIRKHYVLCENSADGDRCLLLLRESRYVQLTSLFSPEHAARRYAKQFEELSKSAVVLLFGIGDGKVARTLLSDATPVSKCVIFEPSLDIFQKAIANYDLQDLIASDQCKIFVRGINDTQFEQALFAWVNYQNWKMFSIAALPVYPTLYPDALEWCYEIYQSVLMKAQATRNTMIAFAQSAFRNEIESLKWIICGKALSALVHAFPKGVPCILVAAGPSLRKNAEELKNAKGKAVIICVDTALHYLLSLDILPDFICTVDATKEGHYYDDPRAKDLPVLISTSSNSHSLDTLGNITPIYIMTGNAYTDYVIKQGGQSVPDYGDGGGSVATVAFSVAVKMGFETIIIIGQDLAYSGLQSHADMSVVQTEADLNYYDTYEVEGYYGEPVIARQDFKIYLDWYNRTIGALPSTIQVINSTEGGAKLSGAIQMPLAEAIREYCKQPVDCREILANIPDIYPSEEAKKQYYHEELKGCLSEMKRVRTLARETGQLADKAEAMLEQGLENTDEFNCMAQRVDARSTEIRQSKVYDLLLSRVMEQNVKMGDDLDRTEENKNQEQRKLYRMISSHMKEIVKATDEGIDLLDRVVCEVNDRYRYE